jgi:diguanylate cyclase (GGDEF)-like protein
MRKNVYIVALLWICLLSVSLFWNIRSIESNQDRLTIQTARTLFDLMVTVRQWNANHDGVYVKISESTQPNPYLDDPQRDIPCAGLTLTKINPAFMTRQISEITGKKNGFTFHLAGLDPVNPANKADAWEAEALKSFSESDIDERGLLTRNDGQPSFIYMKGLRAEKSCLNCHTNKPYKVNDILGGIRISQLNPPQADTLPVMLWHLIIGSTGFFLILMYGRKLARAYESISHQAVFDALTGIPNRRSFNDRFLAEARRAVRLKSPLSVIMADIDHFKNYNDGYGHAKGDDVLSQIAKTIDSTLRRPVDYCARYGGEEFILILPDTDEKGAVHIAGRILKRVCDLNIEHKYSGTADRVTISLGIATQAQVPINYEDIVNQADQALYRAKANGRNRFETY